jgi:hypothetical protein
MHASVIESVNESIHSGDHMDYLYKGQLHHHNESDSQDFVMYLKYIFSIGITVPFKLIACGQ